MKAAAILTLAALSLGGAEINGPRKDAGPLIAHEWGTFTSVAGEDGSPVEWAPLYGAPDLPCFVAHIGNANFTKWAFSGLVRMETPVLYFYSRRPQTFSVHVDFPQGLITEWYPQASKVTPASAGNDIAGYRNGSIEWNGVSVLPGANLDFPSTQGASRYYAARETDSAPLRIGSQQEKLIFYRGVGSFQVPLRPKYTGDGRLEIGNAGPEPIPLAIVFENHDGRIGYRAVRDIKDAVTVDSPALTGDLEQLRKDLTAALVESGLYQKEASAMVKTWRDSWFEEGTRVFYIVPRAEVDSILPLTVKPGPAQTARVFVGRVEVLSPATRQTLQTAADRGDSATLEKFGRFLSVFAQRMALRSTAVQNALASLGRSGSVSCIP